MRRVTARAAAVLCALACASPALGAVRDGAVVSKPAIAGTPWSDAAVAALDAQLDRAFADAALRGAHAGLLAVDARDGRVLYARNADDAFQPASTLKLLTGSVALDVLGASYRFRTDVVAAGTIADGVLDGTLVLRGGGDPLLSASDLDDAARAIAAAGIRRALRGAAIDDAHDEREPFLPGWSLDDVPYAYAAPVSALAYEHNAVRITVTPGDRPGAFARLGTGAGVQRGVPIEGCTPTAATHVLSAARTGAPGSADTIDVVREPAGCIDVVGSIPFGAPAETLDVAVPDADVYAFDAFSAALARHGIAASSPSTIAGPWPDEHRFGETPASNAPVLWRHDSEPLSDLLRDMWLPSDNLAAELLLREIGFVHDGAPGTTAHGLAAERAWLAAHGVDATAYALADGSGLSTYDRITPRALVAILRAAWDGPYRDAVLDALPVAGVRGTLASSFAGTPAQGHVFAKTGTLAHVAALAGYAANAAHGAVIFALLIDDATADDAALRAARGGVLSALVQGQDGANGQSSR